MKICPYCRNVMATGQTICDVCGETVPDVELVSKKAITLKAKKAPKQVPVEPRGNDSLSEKAYQRGKTAIIIASMGIILLGLVLSLLIFL